MKKIIYLLLLAIPILSLKAQDDSPSPYLIRMHVLEVEGNIGEFIKANKEYYKPLSKQAVEDGKWAGWAMFRSFSKRNIFVFFHHYSSPEQYAKGGSLWGPDEAKRLGLKAPDSSKWKWKSLSDNELWQVNGTVLDNERSNYFVFNKFKFAYPDKEKFIKNNRAWGELVVKPQLEENKGSNWAVATLVTSGSYVEGESTKANGISFDGYDSLEDILHRRSYKENGGISENPHWQNFRKYIVENDLTDFNSAFSSSIYEHLDSTWD
tara:strand:- start:4373 stop:5167 length:795 start_codon:yes stop_codon:yes gene_type:complete